MPWHGIYYLSQFLAKISPHLYFYDERHPFTHTAFLHILASMPLPTHEKALLGASAATLASGLAGQALHARHISSDQPYSEADQGVVHKFMDTAKTWNPNRDPREMASEYAAVGSPASSLSVGGLHPADIAKAYAGISGNTWTPGHTEHYEQFQHGPMTGYLLRHKEFMEGGMKTPHGATFADVERGAQDPSVGLPSAPDFAGHLTALHRDVAGHPIHLDPTVLQALQGRANEVSEALGYPADISKLTPEQEVHVFQNFSPYVQANDPALFANKQVLDYAAGTEVPHAGGLYNNMAHFGDALGHTENAAHSAGTFMADHADALTGAGLGGLGVSAVLSLLRSRQPEPKLACVALECLCKTAEFDPIQTPANYLREARLSPWVPAAIGAGVGALGLGAMAAYNHLGDGSASDYVHHTTMSSVPAVPASTADAWKAEHYDPLQDSHKIMLADKFTQAVGDPTSGHLRHPVSATEALKSIQDNTSWLERAVAGDKLTSAATQFGNLPPEAQAKLYDTIRSHALTLPR